MLERGDAARAARALDKLTQHGLCDWALTGGLAVALQISGREEFGAPRALNDVDIVVPDVAAASPAISTAFLIRHFHRNAERGKLLIQLIDVETRVRIDVFTAIGETLGRARCDIAGAPRLVAREDLACRALMSVLPLTRGEAAPEKHWSTLRSLLQQDLSDTAEAAWREHRRGTDQALWPSIRAVASAAAQRPDLLVVERYATDVRAVCAKCVRCADFPLAPAEDVRAILGYC